MKCLFGSLFPSKWSRAILVLCSPGILKGASLEHHLDAWAYLVSLCAGKLAELGLHSGADSCFRSKCLSQQDLCLGLVCLCGQKCVVKFLVFCTDLSSKYDKGRKTVNCEHRDAFKKTELAVVCEIPLISHLLSPYPISHLSIPYSQDLSNSTSKFSSRSRGLGGGVKLWQMFLP